ncbi:putative acyl transferase acyl hydrolase lysophospholipase [Ceratocystis lukuohia]|uniref:Acyl transferase acyl hydrolase lysophospholipase n=1 Tax=Ceratocystis lukuohia TaxID=2019550 RepID=A0ABR4MFA4_9PEZI
MSSATRPNGNARPFKILSLDDGAIGGLSSLLILENIMENIQDAEDLPGIPKPCERFDLIGGTGTGGAALTPGERSWSTILQAKSTPTTNLENALKKAIRENCPLEGCVQEREADRPTGNTCQHEDEKFLDQKCVKTVVLATTKVNIDATPILFRTYRATTGLSKCKIWEVGRATSAMTGLFKHIKLGRENEKFINSSFGYSNPCKVLINEAKELRLEQQEMLILSIGTCLDDTIAMGNTKKSIKRSLRKMATSSRRIANELKEEYKSQKERYYRFNTANGDGAIAAQNWVEAPAVAAHTHNYLNGEQDDIKRFTKILINGFPLVSQEQEVVQKLQQPQQPQQPKKPDSDGPGPVYRIPLKENLKFVGRQDVLSNLDDKLFTDTGFHQIALVALGGMGKTQVALKFAYTVKAKYPDYSVFWLTAASMDGFRNSCKELTAELEIETSDSEDPRLLVKNYLDANVCGKWLLILDNVDDDSLFDVDDKDNRISSFLPQSEKGRILFTTRSTKVSWLAAQNDKIELGEMSSDDLTTILISGVRGHSYGSHVQHEVQINELLNELCHLPLAVAQAADYMAVNQISIVQYLQLLRESNEGKIELLRHRYRDNVHIDSSQGAVATTWHITFRKIEKDSPDAVELLRFIAKVEAKAIPLSMLPGPEKTKPMLEAIGLLLSYGFLHKQNTPGIFDMHSLVHLTAQLWFKGLEDEEDYMLTVVHHMTSIFPSDEWENRVLWRQYLTHALRVIKIEKSLDESIAELEFKVSCCLLNDGNYQEAVRMLEDVVKTREKALAGDHPSRLASQYELALAYHRHGEIKKAVSMIKHVVETTEKALAADHPSRLTYQHELAAAYLAHGQTGKAVSMLEHVVKTREKALAVGHPDRLASQHELAQAYYKHGQIEKAVSMLEHVVETEEKALVVDHPLRLTSQYELARAYYANNKPQAAIELLQHVVHIDEISQTRIPKHRVWAQELLERWLARQPNSQDVSS